MIRVIFTSKQAMKYKGEYKMSLLLQLMPRKLIQELFIQLGSYIRMIAAGLIFFSPLHKKAHYRRRLTAALLICLAVCAISAYMRFLSDHILIHFATQLICFAAPFLIIMLTRSGTLDTRLKIYCAAIAAEEIAGDIFFLLVRLTGNDDHETISLFRSTVTGQYQTTIWDWLLYFAINILLYYLFFRLFRYNQYEELDRESRRPTLALTVFCILALSIPDCIRSAVSADSSLMPLFYRFYLITVAVLILFYCRQIAFHSRYRMEKEIVDQVLSEERKQYQQLKENIDVINMRCHDLKHQLDDFSGKLTEQEVEELRDAMEFYDSNIKTGNEVLDVVLRLSKLTCDREHIQLSCLADGNCLSFMRTRHLYSLFNNAIGNAIEAVRKLPEEDKRVISISAGKHGERAEIEITNYFDGQPVSAGDTTKEDRSHHGFGTMSMRYVVEEYGGNLSIQTQKDIFTLLISIPVPQNAEVRNT
jgi:hypothetical protein